MFKSSGFFLSNLYPHCGAWTHNTEIKSCMLCTDWARQASLQVKFLIFVTILGKKGCSNRPHWFWWLKQVEVYFQLWESPGQIFTDRGPGRSDWRNQASSVLWHHHPQAMLLRLPSGSPASQPKGPHGGTTQGRSWGQAWGPPTARRLLAPHWLQLSHVTTLSLKGSWEMWPGTPGRPRNRHTPCAYPLFMLPVCAAFMFLCGKQHSRVFFFVIKPFTVS